MSLSDRFVFAIGVIVANVPEGLLPDGDALAGARDAADGAAQRARAPPVGRRDARLDHGDLHRQDRDADREPDDRAPGLDAERRAGGRAAPGYAPDGRLHGDRRGRVDPAALAELCPRRRAVQRRVPGAHRRALGRHRRPDRGRPADARRARPGSTPSSEAHRYPRRAELPFDSAPQADDDGARGAGRPHRLRQGRAVRRSSPCTTPRRTCAPARARGRRRDGAAVAARARCRAAGPAARADACAPTSVERELELLGLVGMHDPPRPEVADGHRSAAGARASACSWSPATTASRPRRSRSAIGLVAGRATIIDGRRARPARRRATCCDGAATRRTCSSRA